MKNTEHQILIEKARQLVTGDIPAIMARLSEVRGSTPRDAGTFMLVTGDTQFGTVGGGQLEWLVLQSARQMLDEGIENTTGEIPLGPEIGQCCGGHVTVKFSRLTAQMAEKMTRDARQYALPQVQIHGAGHTGKALIKNLSLLPFGVSMVDSRPEVITETRNIAAGEGIGSGVDWLMRALPGQAVQNAAPNTAFLAMTHAHHLDFLITAEALKRGDAAYVGMIGSKTKRAVFGNWLGENGYSKDLLDRLTCPIGGTLKDKRPEIIAALVAAELIGVFHNRQGR